MGIRTPDLRNAIATLSQLSYSPMCLALSGACERGRPPARAEKCTASPQGIKIPWNFPGLLGRIRGPVPLFLIFLACFAPQQPEEARRQALEPDPRVLVRALIDDDIAGNAEHAWEALIARGERSRDALREGLGSADPQQRFLSATALAHAGAEAQDVPTICAVLWPHLEANSVPGDLEMAQSALAALGRSKHRLALVHWLREARRTSGGQATAAMESIGMIVGLHLEWERSYPWPTRRPRYTLPKRAQWPMLMPRASSWTPDRYVMELVLELGEDGVRRNASSAIRELSPRMSEAVVRRALQRALFDPDRQRRQFAWGVWVLAVHPTRGMRAEIPEESIPWETLDQMALEALEDDRVTIGGSGFGNASRAVQYFEHRGSAGWSSLRRGLLSDDPIQRVRCAVLQVATGDPLARGSASVFQQALQDNRVSNDAMAVQHVLIGLGTDALDWMAAWGPPADGQERVARRVIREHVIRSSAEERERHRWRALARLSSMNQSTR